MTRPRPEIATVGQLLAADAAAIVEIAAYAKTRLKVRGTRAAMTISQVELLALALIAEAHLEDHPAALPVPAPMPAAAPDSLQ